jgi:hypothetical protein
VSELDYNEYQLSSEERGFELRISKMKPGRCSFTQSSTSRFNVIICLSLKQSQILRYVKHLIPIMKSQKSAGQFVSPKLPINFTDRSPTNANRRKCCHFLKTGGISLMDPFISTISSQYGMGHVNLKSKILSAGSMRTSTRPSSPIEIKSSTLSASRCRQFRRI